MFLGFRGGSASAVQSECWSRSSGVKLRYLLSTNAGAEARWRQEQSKGSAGRFRRFLADLPQGASIADSEQFLEVLDGLEYWSRQFFEKSIPNGFVRVWMAFFHFWPERRGRERPKSSAVHHHLGSDLDAYTSSSSNVPLPAMKFRGLNVGWEKGVKTAWCGRRGPLGMQQAQWSTP